MALRVNAQPRSQKRVSFILRENTVRHCFGVNSLTCSENLLFSGGRDGVVHCWNTASGENQWICTLDEHTDWVTETVFLEKHQLLLSSSHDAFINVWKKQDTYSIVTRLSGHTDYIKCLSHASDTNFVVSGGLDECVVVWDIERNIKKDRKIIPPGFHCKKSIYALDVDKQCHTVVTGSPDKVLRVWDLRENGEKRCKLRGHSGSVRRVRLSPDGLRCISSASDGSIRLWDLAEQRCIQSYYPHQDSVWALYVDWENDWVISGGRDKVFICLSLSFFSPSFVFLSHYSPFFLYIFISLFHLLPPPY